MSVGIGAAVKTKTDTENSKLTAIQRRLIAWYGKLKTDFWKKVKKFAIRAIIHHVVTRLIFSWGPLRTIAMIV